uniref:Reverse transcriptase domain-containing protein n=1 Tax=Rhabditophanes sp. KR3021 TaxID=114890 RepID=A0AC35U2E6_9BILA
MEICRCMMVSQPDKDPRLVLIPKNINKHLRAEAKVMLTLKDLLKSAGSSMYSTLDIKSAYNLIDIKKEDRKFCCFSTEFGVYQASRLQFGFKDAPSHFISVLDKILANIPFTAKFMDDIICYAPPDSHEDTVIRIIEELGKANFKLSLKKCHFMKPAVKYIGLETSSDGIFIPNARSDSLARSRSPKSLKELTSILCCLSFYRPFIAKFPELSENLYGKKQFSWSIADEKNFREILRLVSVQIRLHCVTDTSSDFRLCLSFGERSFSYALFHGEALFILGGRTLKKHEANYSSISKYARAIKEALFENSSIINSNVVVVEVEDSGVRRILSKPPIMDEINNRVMSHLMPLECFNLKFVASSARNILNDIRVESLDKIVVPEANLRH